MKRKLFTFLVLTAIGILFTANVWSQFPAKMSYQAVIRDAENNLVTNQQVGMQISILQGSAEGTPVYVETHAPSTNANGLITIEIGAGVTSDKITIINWAEGPYFVKTETDLDGGTNYTITGISQLLSVPYALHAKTAEVVNETDPVFGTSPSASITGTDIDNWNNKLNAEEDGDASNEIQALSISNDTIFLSDGGFVKLPANTSFSGSYNDLTDIPNNMDTDATDDFDGDFSSLTNVPTGLSDGDDDTQLSEIEVDSYVSNNGYLTTEVDGDASNEIQALSISNDTIYLSNGGYVKLPAGFSGSFNDLTDVPGNLDTDATDDFDGDFFSLTNVPAGLSDGDDDTQLTETEVDSYVSNNGYLTAEIDGDASNEIQALSIGNDTIYLSDGGYVKLPVGFSGSFNDLTNVPVNLDIDATDDFDGDFTSLSNIPTGLWDGDDDTQLSETEVDSYVSNNGYLTAELDGDASNEIQVLSISNDTIFLTNGEFVKLPAETDPVFTSWDKDYSDLINTPSIPEDLSDLYDDVGYLTSEVDGDASNEIQVLSISNDTIFLTNGGFVELPAETDSVFTAWDKDYYDLINSPQNISDFDNDAGYLTSEVDGDASNEIQVLSISNDTIFLTNGGFVKLPAETDPVFSTWDKDYADLINSPQDVSEFNNDAGYLTAEVDGDVSNEIQTISRSGLTVTLSNSGGTFSDSVLTETDVDNFVSNNGYATTNMGNQNITDLADPVNDQDAATKAYIDAIKEAIYNDLYDEGAIEDSLMFARGYIDEVFTSDTTGKVRDIDGNEYNFVKIGTQYWLAENLKTTTLNDGSAIPNVTDNTTWQAQTTPAYCWYDNDEATYKNVYGALYNWYTIGTGNLCPDGWHVPTEAEWNTLVSYAGGYSVAGGKLKETGTTHWTSPNVGATDEFGFKGLPGGLRSSIFMNVDKYGYWFYADYATNPGLVMLSYDYATKGGGSGVKWTGTSARCIRD